MMTWLRQNLRWVLDSESASLYVIWLVSVLHWAWAILLISTAAAAHATPVAAVITLTGSRAAAVIALAGTAVLAQAAAWLHRHPLHQPAHPRRVALMLIPQQFLLFVSAGGGIGAAAAGHYADGVVRPWQFIIGDQLPVILIALLYTTAILIIGRIKRPQ